MAGRLDSSPGLQSESVPAPGDLTGFCCDTGGGSGWWMCETSSTCWTTVTLLRCLTEKLKGSSFPAV